MQTQPPQLPPAPAVRPRPGQKTKQVVTGFNDFVKQYGIAPLAIGVVIGTAVNDFVKSLVDGLITPFIALFSPGTQLQNFQFQVGQSIFKIGQVLNAFLSFLVVAWVVYVIAKLILRNDALLEKK